jgi:hypothetical protein
MTRKLLLSCGVVSALLHVAMNAFVPRYEGYGTAWQTASELSAIGAPTTTPWLQLGAVHAALTAAFAWGVWISADGNRRLRAAGGLLLVYGIAGLLWPPMHLRETGFTLSGMMHVPFARGTALLLMLAIGFGAAALGTWFRLLSLVIAVILFVFNVLSGVDGDRIAANVATWWVGVWERIGIAAFLLWLVVFSIVLLQAQMERPPTSSVGGTAARQRVTKG